MEGAWRDGKRGEEWMNREGKRMMPRDRGREGLKKKKCRKDNDEMKTQRRVARRGRRGSSFS